MRIRNEREEGVEGAYNRAARNNRTLLRAVVSKGTSRGCENARIVSAISFAPLLSKARRSEGDGDQLLSLFPSEAHSAVSRRLSSSSSSS